MAVLIGGVASTAANAPPAANAVTAASDWAAICTLLAPSASSVAMLADSARTWAAINGASINTPVTAPAPASSHSSRASVARTESKLRARSVKSITTTKSAIAFATSAGSAS
jgi:hypothetical protein